MVVLFSPELGGQWQSTGRGHSRPAHTGTVPWEAPLGGGGFSRGEDRAQGREPSEQRAAPRHGGWGVGSLPCPVCFEEGGVVDDGGKQGREAPQ